MVVAKHWKQYLLSFNNEHTVLNVVNIKMLVAEVVDGIIYSNAAPHKTYEHEGEQT